MAAALGDTLAIAADPNGGGATAGDTTVGTPPAEPTADGVTVTVAPGGDLPPIVVTIP